VLTDDLLNIYCHGIAYDFQEYEMEIMLRALVDYLVVNEEYFKNQRGVDFVTIRCYRIVVGDDKLGKYRLFILRDKESEEVKRVFLGRFSQDMDEKFPQGNSLPLRFTCGIYAIAVYGPVEIGKFYRDGIDNT